MSKLIAKPIVDNQYWVVTDGVQKVGNVTADGSGFSVVMNGTANHFENTSDIRSNTRIQFQTVKTNKNKIHLPFAQFPTTPKVHNSILDIKRKLHLYTKSAKSKCYYAAGWFALKQNDSFEPVFCPKYIFIQRYEYHGPFQTKEEVVNMINTA
jgi:hypothetical protein